MANKVDLILTNDLGQSTTVDVNDFPYRLNRKVFTASDDKLKVLGGTFSTQIELSKSKRNNQFFVGKTEIKSSNKFYNLKYYSAVILENGVEVVRGKFKLEEITNKSYIGTFYDNDIDWVDNLSNIRLNQLGYVDGLPTWLAPFDGAASFNTVNEQTNRQTDYICPTIIYNNTPITDYLDLTDEDIWGTYDTNPSPPPAYIKIKSGNDYPNDFITETGFFGDRLGLTFEDFPPALYYRNVLEKVIDEIGFEIECPLFDEEWFNKLYMSYSGDGYKYNWKNLATVSAELIAKIEDNISGGTYDNIDDIYEADIDVPNQKVLPAAGVQPWFQDIILKYGAISTIGYDDTTTLVDKITAINPFGIPNQYIVPETGRYKIRIDSAGSTEYTNLLLEYDVGLPVFEAYDIFNSYGSGDVNSVKTDPIADRAYAWDDHVLVILRKNQNDDFVFNTEQLLGQWMSGTNQDFLVNPSDVIAYLSPKRYELYQLGVLTNEREAFGSPITNFIEPVTVTPGSISHTVFTNTNTDKSATSAGEMEVTIDLLKNERIEIVWVAIETFKGSTFFHPSQSLENINDAAIGTNQTVSGGSTYEISYECGEYDLDLASNLPNITAKDFISSFINQFNLFFTVSGNVIQFLPQSNYYTPEVYDITSRVINNTWSCQPLVTPKQLTIGYNIDNNDRFLTNIVNNCVTDDSFISNYGNVTLTNDNVYGNDFLNNVSIFSSTQFFNGHVRLQPYSVVAITIPTSTDTYSSGAVIDKGFVFFSASEEDFHMDIPSVQSDISFRQVNVGMLEYNYNYTPRLLYHLGTTYTYLGLDILQGALIDSPRADEPFCRLDKHWYRPTVSAFHEENNNPYRTLRYDTVNGLYNVYFENLVDLYNKSEILTLNMAVRNIDWINMKGSKKIKYQDSLYRLMSIEQYDPLRNTPCVIKLLKEI